MREIKFRAWDIRNEVMWLRKPKQLTSEFFQLIEQDQEGGEQFILMQFTGPHDRNGVEIYEGDILKLDNMMFTFEWKEEYKFGFCAGWKIRHISGYRGSPKMSDCEVIGNIYENPELLQDKETE